MPNVKLPTGVDLYYETHGSGEPLIFVPSTAYSGEVWKPSQMPLANSLNIDFSRSARLRPIGGDAVCLHHRADGPGHRRDDGSFEAACGAFDRPLHGRAHRVVAGAELSRQSKKLDHGGKRFRYRRPGPARIAFLVCRIAWSTTWSRWASRNLSTMRSSIRIHFSPKIIATAHRDQVEAFFKLAWATHAKLSGVHSSVHRAAQLRRHAPPRRRPGADFGADRRGRHGRQQSPGASQVLRRAHPRCGNENAQRPVPWLFLAGAGRNQCGNS